MLRAERVVSHNAIVVSGTVAAGVLGVAFQSLVSHRLQPAEYGAVFAVVSLITFIGLPASAFTLLMARTTSRDRAAGRVEPSASLLRNGNITLLAAGVIVGAALVVASPYLGRFFAVRTDLILAAAAGMPFAMAFPLMLGEFQGEQQFVGLSLLVTGQAALKLVAAIGLGYLWGAVGIVGGISAAGAVTYLAAVGATRHKLAMTTRAPWLRSAGAYLAIVIPSTLALAVLLSADVLLVKHYFSTQLAGEYAAVAALGRAIFWGASGVAAVLFPKIAMKSAKGDSGAGLIGASLALVALGGAFGLALLTIGSSWLLSAFAGGAYAGAAIYLPWYAIGMIMLGGAAVLIATHQSTGRPGFLAVLLPLSLLEPMLLIAFHRNLAQVVLMVDVSMAAVVVGLGALLLLRQPKAREVPSPTAIATNPAGPN